MKLHERKELHLADLGKEIDSRFLRVFKEWKYGLITATEAIRQIDMKRTTFYRRVREVDETQEAETEV